MKFYRFLAEPALSPSTSLRTGNSEVVEMTSRGLKKGFLEEPALRIVEVLGMTAQLT